MTRRVHQKSIFFVLFFIHFSEFWMYWKVYDTPVFSHLYKYPKESKIQFLFYSFFKHHGKIMYSFVPFSGLISVYSSCLYLPMLTWTKTVLTSISQKASWHSLRLGTKNSWLNLKVQISECHVHEGSFSLFNLIIVTEA